MDPEAYGKALEALYEETIELVPPPVQQKEPSPELSRKIESWLRLKEAGTSLNERLMQNKAFRNPTLYAKLIEFVSIDEFGTNYAKDVSLDPKQLPKEAHYRALGDAQRHMMEAKAAATQAKRADPSHLAQIPFVPPSRPSPSSTTTKAATSTTTRLSGPSRRLNMPK